MRSALLILLAAVIAVTAGVWTVTRAHQQAPTPETTYFLDTNVVVSDGPAACRPASSPPVCYCAVVDDSDVWRSECDQPCRDERSPGWSPERERRMRK